MSRRFIPGHVRAHTWVACMVLGLLTYVITSSVISTVGSVLLVLGMFLGDQATHLAQENHQGLQATWIEEQMQERRWLFVVLGLLVSAAGLFLLVSKH